jgi:hypothetical protein
MESIIEDGIKSYLKAVSEKLGINFYELLAFHKFGVDWKTSKDTIVVVEEEEEDNGGGGVYIKDECGVVYAKVTDDWDVVFDW